MNFDQPQIPAVDPEAEKVEALRQKKSENHQYFRANADSVDVINTLLGKLSREDSSALVQAFETHFKMKDKLKIVEEEIRILEGK